MKTINWVFFDVGGVLLNDIKHEKRRVDLILKAVKVYQPAITRKDVWAVRPQASTMPGSLTGNMVKLLANNHQQADQIIQIIGKGWSSNRDLVIRRGAKRVVESLAQKYNLGLLANQPVRVKEKLRKAGILKYFKFQNVSADFNLAKPDPQFFKEIFKITGADPKKSVIIDDNIERSLIPAKKLGMITVWFKLEDRDFPKKEIDFVVDSLEDLLSII